MRTSSAQDIIRAAGRERSDVVVFPELLLTGYDLGRAQARPQFWGGSHIIDPWGRVICELPDEEATATYEIDFAMVRQRRREVPLVREARLGLLAREATRLAEEGGDA